MTFLKYVKTVFVKHVNCVTECAICSLLSWRVLECMVAPESCYSYEAIPVIVVVSYCPVLFVKPP